MLYTKSNLKKFLIGTSLGFTIFIISPIFLINTRIKASEIKLDEKDVVIEELVEDDLIIKAENIEINDDIKGDLIAVGGKITINDDIYGDAIIVGVIIKIKGDIRGNLTCLGGDVVIDGDIEKDLNVFTSIVNINGNISDDVRVLSAISKINSTKIGDNLFVAGASSKISENTEIGGDKNIYIQEKSKIPTLDINYLLQFTKQSFTSIIISILRKIALLAGWILVGWTLFKAAPVKSTNIVDILSKKDTSIKSLLTGIIFILSLIIIFPILILLSIIGIGQPMTQLFTIVLAFLLSIGGIYSSTAIAKLILSRNNKRPKSNMLSMIVGITLYQLTGFIPLIACCLGTIVRSLLTIWGLGGILYMKWKMLEDSKKGIHS